RVRCGSGAMEVVRTSCPSKQRGLDPSNRGSKPSVGEDALGRLAQTDQAVLDRPVDAACAVLAHLEAHPPAVALRQVLDAELIDQAYRVVEAVVAVVRERPATRRLQPRAAADLVDA